MTVTLRYAARSDVGLVRSNNQDSAYAGPNLLVVADGMGGHAGGDVASALTIAALAPLDRPDHGPDQALTDLEQTVDRARQDLVRATVASPELAGMGTTVTALLRTGNTLAMAHLGDSRAYLLREGVLTQVTVDHTFVQHLVDTGRISPDEAEHHPQRNVVMRVLGDFDLDLTPDMSVREARPGDRWMLCSDGLSGFVPFEQITDLLTETPEPIDAVERLVSLAMRSGSTDNITVVVADVLDDRNAAVAGPEAAAAREPLVVGAAELAGVGARLSASRSGQASGTTAPGAPRAPGTAPPDGGDAPSSMTQTMAQAFDAVAAAHDGGGTDGSSEAHGAVATLTDPLAVPRSVDGAEAGPENLDDPTADDADARPAPKARPWLTVLGALLLVGGLAVAGWAGYRWTQGQYYVGAADGQVAIYRGIPATAGPITLSRPVELTGTAVADLPAYIADAVGETIRASSLEDARSRVDRLIAEAEAETPEPSASPSASPTASPSEVVSPTPNPSETAG
ncbi:protein phosphatase 2C domain-containing protein [Antribacter sp. KLBMP9083]|uniref:Protein phosphatase 2C domain-containing protein n=1 Tax=Antribacter soli TaxID=2910976 RepID=A0AA41QD90_9MICO|nr:PP2C family serine/threonine-protein phosphatase [Antribacter soli]MCF4120471.1 protein phosphatase 2C domain-containing protein [Antribacter soli]